MLEVVATRCLRFAAETGARSQRGHSGNDSRARLHRYTSADPFRVSKYLSVLNLGNECEMPLHHAALYRDPANPASSTARSRALLDTTRAVHLLV
jgi:hypothetical protein